MVAVRGVADMWAVGQNTEDTYILVVAFALAAGRIAGRVAHGFVTKRLMLENWIEVYDKQVVGRDVAACEQQP